MKKPYLDQEDRFSIRLNTTYGAFRMLDFRFAQLGKALAANDRVITIGYVISVLGAAAMAIQLLYQVYDNFK